jgi:glutamate dehydrogenase
VLTAGLQWRDVALIRTISRFLRQARVAYSQDYLWATLRRFPEIAAQIVQIFHTRFDPRLQLSIDARGKKPDAFLRAIEEALGAVESLDEDRILRHFVNAVTSALRSQIVSTTRRGKIAWTSYAVWVETSPRMPTRPRK